MFNVHHFCISVSNRMKSEKFYAGLGFKKIYQWDAEDKSLSIVQLKNQQGIMLELFCYAIPKDPPPYWESRITDNPVIGLKHFALQSDSIEKAKKELIKQKIKIITDITQGRTGVKYLFIRDPDGIWIEIIEDKRNL
jgi:glyoxylase I family protein